MKSSHITDSLVLLTNYFELGFGRLILVHARIVSDISAIDIMDNEFVHTSLALDLILFATSCDFSVTLAPFCLKVSD